MEAISAPGGTNVLPPGKSSRIGGVTGRLRVSNVGSTANVVELFKIIVYSFNLQIGLPG